MKADIRRYILVQLERARRPLDAEWVAQLIGDGPDWMRLFELHWALVRIERRARLLGGPR